MKKKCALSLGVSAMILFAGCAPKAVNMPWPEPGPLGQDITAYRPPQEAPQEEPASFGVAEPTGAITLREALSLALMGNPELAAFSWDIRAAEAKMLQAGLIPNPEFEGEIEWFAGSGELSGFDASESHFMFSQLIELGGKRTKREKVAAVERDLGGWDYEGKRLDVFTETTKAFVDVLATQEKLALSENTYHLAERVHQVVKDRVEAGKVSPLEETKSAVALSTSEIELVQTRRALEATRKRLAATWGSAAATFARAEDSLETIGEIPSLEHLLEKISQNPDVARWEAEVALRKAKVDLEKAEGIPDVVLGAGPEYSAETDDYAFQAVMAVPIPLFDRNQGAISEATYLLTKSMQERSATILRIKTALSDTYETLASSYSQAESLRKSVLPAAHDAFDAATEGYQEGKFEYLEVLDAQRTLFIVRAQYIDALANYHKARADAERLIGQRLNGTEGTN
jgi:cobalt-zinc-cadmium efflux system outer membrane protein